MRNKILPVILIYILSGLVTQAQTQMKIGYADVEYILGKMPEVNQVQAELEASIEKLENQLQTIYKEYTNKLQDYEKSAPSMSDSEKQEKETELTQLKEKIQESQSMAEYSIKESKAAQLKPLYEKIKNTIKTVAKEEGFTHILNKQSDELVIVLYSEEEFNISDKVLKKMGVE